MHFGEDEHVEEEVVGGGGGGVAEFVEDGYSGGVVRWGGWIGVGLGGDGYLSGHFMGLGREGVSTWFVSSSKYVPGDPLGEVCKRGGCWLVASRSKGIRALAFEIPHVLTQPLSCLNEEMDQKLTNL